MTSDLPKKDTSAFEEVDKRVRKALGVGSPQEVMNDSMAILYRPNNFRRQTQVGVYIIAVKRLNNSGVWKQSARSKLMFQQRGRITLQLGRKVLTAIWNQNVEGKREVFRFQGSAEQIAQGILEVKERIRAELDKAIVEVCDVLGKVPREIVWERAEESIRGDEYLDKLPQNMVLHDTIFRKVYAGETEFLTRKGEEPSIKVKNYIKNRALEDFAPEIAQAIREVGAHRDLLGEVKDLVRVFPNDLLREDVKRLIGELSAHEKDMLSDWVFERFGR